MEESNDIIEVTADAPLPMNSSYVQIQTLAKPQHSRSSSATSMATSSTSASSPSSRKTEHTGAKGSLPHSPLRDQKFSIPRMPSDLRRKLTARPEALQNSLAPKPGVLRSRRSFNDIEAARREFSIPTSKSIYNLRELANLSSSERGYPAVIRKTSAVGSNQLLSVPDEGPPDGTVSDRVQFYDAISINEQTSSGGSTYAPTISKHLDVGVTPTDPKGLLSPPESTRIPPATKLPSSTKIPIPSPRSSSASIKRATRPPDIRVPGDSSLPIIRDIRHLPGSPSPRTPTATTFQPPSPSVSPSRGRGKRLSFPSSQLLASDDAKLRTLPRRKSAMAIAIHEDPGRASSKQDVAPRAISKGTLYFNETLFPASPTSASSGETTSDTDYGKIVAQASLADHYSPPMRAKNQTDSLSRIFGLGIAIPQSSARILVSKDTQSPKGLGIQKPSPPLLEEIAQVMRDLRLCITQDRECRSLLHKCPRNLFREKRFIWSTEKLHEGQATKEALLTRMDELQKVVNGTSVPETSQ
ncbi:hypothetical protein FRB99_005529 [Tulasnella sp. 403]|nr:hypothetical protein FRB99_005529 [Tulasnella sp. 403]